MDSTLVWNLLLKFWCLNVFLFVTKFDIIFRFIFEYIYSRNQNFRKWLLLGGETFIFPKIMHHTISQKTWKNGSMITISYYWNDYPNWWYELYKKMNGIQLWTLFYLKGKDYFVYYRPWVSSFLFVGAIHIIIIKTSSTHPKKYGCMSPK